MTKDAAPLAEQLETALGEAMIYKAQRDSARRSLDNGMKPVIQQLGIEGAYAAIAQSYFAKMTAQQHALHALNKAHARTCRRDKANKELRRLCKELLAIMSVMVNMPNAQACRLLGQIEAIVNPPNERKKSPRPWSQNRDSMPAPGR